MPTGTNIPQQDLGAAADYSKSVAALGTTTAAATDAEVAAHAAAADPHTGYQREAQVFVSTEQTGTGSAQNVAHGLASTPSKVFIAPTDTNVATVGAYTVVEGTHDATNVVVTVTSGKKFKVLAFV